MVRLSCCLRNSGLTARLHDSTSSPSRSADKSLIRGASTASVGIATINHVFMSQSTHFLIVIYCMCVKWWWKACRPHPVRLLEDRLKGESLWSVFPRQTMSCWRKRSHCTHCPPLLHHSAVCRETKQVGFEHGAWVFAWVCIQTEAFKPVPDQSVPIFKILCFLWVESQIESLAQICIHGIVGNLLKKITTIQNN